MDQENTNPLADSDAERAVIAACFNSNPMVDRFTYLEPEDFTDRAHSIAWKGLTSFRKKGMLATPQTLFQAFSDETKWAGVRDYWMSLCASETMDPEPAAVHVKDLSVRRGIAAYASQAAKRALNFDAPSDELLAQAMGDLTQLASGSPRSAIRNSQVNQSIIDDLDRPAKIYSSGIPTLDKILHGGFHAGRLYAICARMKVGKSITLSTFSYNLNMGGVPHLYIAAEMGCKGVQVRNLARAVGCASGEFKKRGNPEFKQRVQNVADTMPDHAVWENAAGATLDDVRRMIASAKLKYGIKGVIVDYLQLIEGRKKGDNEEQHLRQVAQTIANICVKEDLFAIVAAQLNQENNTRGGEGMQLACDHYFVLNREEGSEEAWLDQKFSRHEVAEHLGSPAYPGLKLMPHGPHFVAYPRNRGT